MTLLRARAGGIRNFSVFCNHVTIEPPLRAILAARQPGSTGSSARATSGP